MTYNFDNYEKDALTKPRDLAWTNWAKFEAIGDKVQGFIRDVFYHETENEDGKEPTKQRVLTLEQQDGVLVNASIKHISFVLKQTDHLHIGDPVTIEFEKELPPKKPMHKPTKVFGFYGTILAENATGKTIKELEDEDRDEDDSSAEEKKAQDDFDGINDDAKTETAKPAAPVAPAPTEGVVAQNSDPLKDSPAVAPAATETTTPPTA